MMLAPCGSTPNTRQQYNARPMWINTQHKAAVWCSPHVEQHKCKAAVQCSPHVEQHKCKAAVQCSPHVDQHKCKAAVRCSPHVNQHQTQGSSTMLTPCGSTPNTRQQYDAHPMWINSKHKTAIGCSPHVDQHQTQGSSTMLSPCGSSPNARQQNDARPMWINTKDKAAVLCSPHVDQHQTQGSSTMLTPCGSTPNTRQQYESCPMWSNTNARQQSIVNLACRRIYPSLVLVQPRKTSPCLTKRLLMGPKESNQTNNKPCMLLLQQPCILKKSQRKWECPKSSFWICSSFVTLWYEPVHEISNNVVCATSKASDQPAHTRSLIRAFASRLSILWLLSYWLNTIWCF